MRIELADAIGADQTNVENKVCHIVGRFLEQSGDPYAGILQWSKNWKRSGMPTSPPFTAVLFCLSHAAELMTAEGDYSSNNYYYRLSQVTGIERSVLSFNGKSTDILWKFLNEWLLENDYQLGRPTAKTLSKWKYVGKALSQAAVRAVDRSLFHDLFDRYGFSGSEIISIAEMRHYLSNWIHSSKPNARLKAAWKNRELQVRVCEAAIAEYSVWISDQKESEPQNSKSNRTSRLSLALNLVHKFPNKKLEFHLGRIGEEERRGPYKSELDHSDYYLANDSFGNLSTIVPNPFGNEIALLTRQQSFNSELQNLQWHPRLIIPFVKSSVGPFWVEVARVTFGTPHILIVRDLLSLPEKVERYLAHSALDCPSRAKPSEISGLPTGWVLYKDVRVGQPKIEPDEDLECLVPLGEQGSINIIGGLPLLPSFYHRNSCLEIEVNASDGPVCIEVSSINDPEKPSLLTKSSENNQVSAKFKPSDFPEIRSVNIKAFQNDNVVDEREIFFRDGNRPAPLNRSGKGIVSYGSILSASPDDINGTRIVFGNIVVSNEIPELHLLLKDNSNEPLPSGDNEELQETLNSDAIASIVDGQTCIERGHHYWHCQFRPPELPRTMPLSQTCKDCKQTIILSNRGKSRQNSKNYNPIPLPAITIDVQRSSIDFDVLLDAVCYLGSGSLGKFESLLDLEANSGIYPRSIAQDFFNLGFLDLQILSGTNRIKNWSVPAPAINFIEDKCAFMSGFRCEQMTVEISNQIERIGGHIERKSFKHRPQSIVIVGLTKTVVEDAVSNINDPLGRQITVTESPANSILRASYHFDDLFKQTTPVSIGKPKNLQKFNLKNAKWNNVDFLEGAGAYRWNDGFQSYAYVDDFGQARMGAHNLIKILAARSARIRLHGHNSKDIFHSTLGCEPPGLLERALVAQSGELPKMKNGVLSYSGVTQSVASAIINIMYSESN